jgi:hypothetical protein
MEDSAADLVRSRQRVVDHGEVFTPPWLVERMLDLVSPEAGRIDSRVLEPACGSGNFLVSVLRRKLETVQAKFGKGNFEADHFALLGLMSIYGIELLPDNAQECRDNLLQIVVTWLEADAGGEWAGACRKVLAANIVQGDAIAMATPTGGRLTFPEWGYLGRGRYQRRDFRLEVLAQRSSIEGTLFENLDESDLFMPVKVYEPMKVSEIAR